jgi:cytochrome P450
MTTHQVKPPLDINLLDPKLYSHGDPHAVWRWLRANDPVRWQESADFPGFWILTKYDDVRTVYRDPATFSSAHGILLRPLAHGVDTGGGRTLALTDPPRHKQLRALVDGWFTPRAIRGLEAEMRDLARETVLSATERETCDFVTEVAARIPLYVICGMMGVPRTDWEHILNLTNDAFGADEAIERRMAHLTIMRYFQDLAETRAKNPADDLVSVLVTQEIDGKKLTPEEILLNCDNLLVGGTENTRIAAAGGMHAFIMYPDQWREISADPLLIPSAVEEVLRWTSTATHIMRVATRQVTIRDRRIEAHERVTLWNPSANRDEEVFPDPDRFDIRRQPNRHLALGFGEHFCLGGTLARMELRILYEELMRHAGEIELAGSPVPLASIVVNGLERLPVRLLSPRAESGRKYFL